MDLRYVLLNVQSRLSPGLLCIHRAGIEQEPSSHTSQARNLCYRLYSLVLVSGLPQLVPPIQTPGREGGMEGEADG